MFTNKEPRHIACFKPFWFVRHVVENHLSINTQVFEHNVLQLSLAVVTSNNRKLGISPFIRNVLEKYILNTTPRSRTVLSL